MKTISAQDKFFYTYNSAYAKYTEKLEALNQKHTRAKNHAYAEFVKKRDDASAKLKIANKALKALK